MFMFENNTEEKAGTFPNAQEANKMEICVYGASSDDIRDEYLKAAEKLGRIIAVLSRVMRKIVCRQPREALLCNGGIAESGLQMPHVHVLPVTPLGTCDMAQAGADEHQGRVGVHPKFCVNSK